MRHGSMKERPSYRRVAIDGTWILLNIQLQVNIRTYQNNYKNLSTNCNKIIIKGTYLQQSKSLRYLHIFF